VRHQANDDVHLNVVQVRYCTVWSGISLGLVTLYHPTFRHATVNHRPVIDCAFSNIPIKTEDGQDVHSEHYDSAVFPIQMWTHYEAEQRVLQAEQNAVEGWHFGLQTFFHCHHPTLWTFVQGIKKDFQMQHSLFLPKIASAQPSVTYMDVTQ